MTYFPQIENITDLSIKNSFWININKTDKPNYECPSLRLSKGQVSIHSVNIITMTPLDTQNYSVHEVFIVY